MSGLVPVISEKFEIGKNADSVGKHPGASMVTLAKWQGPRKLVSPGPFKVRSLGGNAMWLEPQMGRSIFQLFVN